VADVPRELTLAPNIINPRAGTPITLTALVRGVTPNGVVSFTTTQISDITNPTIPVVGCTNVPVLLLQADANSAVATCTTIAEAGARRYTATYSNDSLNAVNPVAIATNSPIAGPLDYGDIWWAGPAESGWGMTIAQKGLQQFNAFYVYDAGGKPVWYVMGNGVWNQDYTKFTGSVYQPTGSAFSSYDARRWQIGAPVGTAVITFTNANNAVVDYTINGVTATKNITRFIYGTPDTTPKIMVKDIWWGLEAENGWGVTIAQQDRSLFAAWYTYDADGKTTWFVTSGGGWAGTTFTSELYSTTSSAWLGVVYNATQFRSQPVGTVSFDFRDQDNAKMTYTVNGVTQTKSISRFAF
jgi:chitinase